MNHVTSKSGSRNAGALNQARRRLQRTSPALLMVLSASLGAEAHAGAQPGSSSSAAASMPFEIPKDSRAADTHSLIATKEQRLIPGDWQESAHFGASVTLSGDTALVGAPLDDNQGDDSGAAYVFLQSGGVWAQQVKLVPSDGEDRDWFGHSVVLSGNTALVGAPLDDDMGDDSGAVYVFVQDGGVWTQQAKLLPSDGNFAYFGYSVALSGDTALVGTFEGAWGWQDGHRYVGSAYVFVRNGDVWTQQAKLVPSDGEDHDWFGHSVALSGNTALVGAFGDDDKGSGSGAAYMFRQSGDGVWTQQAKLVPGDGEKRDRFGYSVALSGNTALVGAPRGDDKGYDSGAAYVFVQSRGAWTQRAKLVPSDGVQGDEFGASVALMEDTALVGAPEDDDKGSLSGSAYVFVQSGGVWTPSKLVATDGETTAGFGSSVALSEATALVGAPWDDVEPWLNAGSAYVFECPGGKCGGSVVDGDDAVAAGGCSYTASGADPRGGPLSWAAFGLLGVCIARLRGRKRSVTGSGALVPPRG